MEIKDTEFLYEFLGKLSWIGAFLFLAILSLVVVFFTINISEKIFASPTTQTKLATAIAVSALTIIGGMILWYEANASRKGLKYANSIKFYMIDNKRRFRSIDNIANENVFEHEDKLCENDPHCLEKRTKIIKDVIAAHPDEFILVPVNDIDIKTQNPQVNVPGLELIDGKARKVIDSFEMALLPYFKEKVAYYMIERGIDSLAYSDIFEKVDGRLYGDMIDLMVLHSNGVFISKNKDAQLVLLNQNNPLSRSLKSLLKRRSAFSNQTP